MALSLVNRTIMNRRNCLLVTCAFVLAAPALAAQPVKPASRPAAASIEGDVFLAMRNGDVKRVAGQTVRLFDGRALTDIRALCVEHNREFAATPTNVDVLRSLRDRQRATRELRLERFAVAEAETGADGRFRFRLVAPGTYLLRAEAPLYEARHMLWRTVVVTAGEVSTADLSNRNIVEYATDPLECGAVGVP